MDADTTKFLMWMRTKCCFGCGKPSSIEMPYPADIEPSNRHSNVDDEFRVTYICTVCADRLDLDMWMSQGCWNGIHPMVSYERLPLYSQVYPNG